MIYVVYDFALFDSNSYSFNLAKVNLMLLVFHLLSPTPLVMEKH